MCFNDDSSGDTTWGEGDDRPLILNDDLMTDSWTKTDVQSTSSLCNNKPSSSFSPAKLDLPPLETIRLYSPPSSPSPIRPQRFPRQSEEITDSVSGRINPATCHRLSQPSDRTLVGTPSSKLRQTINDDSVTNLNSVLPSGTICDACDKEEMEGRVTQVLPCKHWLCATCFSSLISAVSVSQKPSKCPSCLQHVSGLSSRRKTTIEEDHPNPLCPASKQNTSSASEVEVNTVVLRIDNVAWDVTPTVVESFLPRHVLPPSHPHPIHILLDRMDGKTKDYLYVEVRSQAAAKEVLQRRQNNFMPGGPLSRRSRPVTITPVTHAELISELRPRSPQELQSLLRLCQASISSPPLTNPFLNHTSSYVSPNGVAHFVKSRHGPFHLLMSILSKLRGKDSPAYWDLLATTSGAIAALATISRDGNTPDNLNKWRKKDTEDEMVLNQLSKMFESCFADLTST
ncbi:hypothetical protein TREMEDRAFT_61175 [Tremella mesenterica DSM 1558]|uniref:uncharacterized protein n=1 Tax=Tremella mesenterica (strain ATCC 24925 / CBS 8224 / DSM 1558 / NBRC 9311 / NRRL Y-6157 / RJB 2259-6 / UBC 559-6) TaxID=578456 RepID=UPI0003F49E2D|nr:uncharacterized protein TREMEDRAFT_61175 [Tremella mesenterica DSM 1558]EIW70667.1 hypothetical protein TREMEDRAFT_61175 [Tremella mesenterica DSM 1558]